LLLLALVAISNILKVGAENKKTMSALLMEPQKHESKEVYKPAMA
jgi:hypothetical protein